MLNLNNCSVQEWAEVTKCSHGVARRIRYLLFSCIKNCKTYGKVYWASNVCSVSLQLLTQLNNYQVILEMRAKMHVDVNVVLCIGVGL